MDDESQRLLKLRTAHQDRLDVLTVQIARMGVDAPPHLLIDADSAKRELRVIDAKLSLPPISPVVTEVFSPADLMLWMEQRIRYLEQRQDAAIGVVRDESREYRTRQDSERAAGQKRTRRLILTFIVAATLLTAAVGVLAGIVIATLL